MQALAESLDLVSDGWLVQHVTHLLAYGRLLEARLFQRPSKLRGELWDLGLEFFHH